MFVWPEGTLEIAESDRIRVPGGRIEAQERRSVEKKGGYCYEDLCGWLNWRAGTRAAAFAYPEGLYCADAGSFGGEGAGAGTSGRPGGRAVLSCHPGSRTVCPAVIAGTNRW